MNIEAWSKNETTSSFDRLTKGAMITVEDCFKPEEWLDVEGVKHNRVILVAAKFYEAVEKETLLILSRTSPRRISKSFSPHKRAAFGSLFCTYTSSHLNHSASF